MTRWRWFVATGMVGVAALALGACGSSGSSTPTPTPKATAAAATATAAATSTAAATPALPQGPVTLTIFAAGTLASPLNAVDQAFTAAHPNVKVQAQFGGSVKEVKQVTDLGLTADVIGVADYNVIPTYMFGNGGKQAFAKWYVGIASNAITFVYTPQSKGASEITADNWYKVLAQPGVRIGRSNPDTDPSGYQTLQMLRLAETYYQQPGLYDSIMANASKTFIRDTETDLIGALQAGEIDYLAIYKSDAIQNKFSYLKLPSAIDLSDATQAASYAAAKVTTAAGELTAGPIIYAVTIPTNAEQPAWAAEWITFLLGPDGQKIFADRGFGAVQPPIAYHADQLPGSLQALTKPWPGS